MVEQEAVNFEVAGSSPAVGAKKNPLAFIVSGFFFVIDVWFSAINRSAERCWVAVR